MFNAGCTSSSPPLAIFACCASQVAESRSLWTVDPAHTSVTFVIDAVGWPQTKGQFTNFQGKIAIDFNNPRASSVSFKVAANSVDAGSDSLNDYLRGEPFFNVTRYPIFPSSRRVLRRSTRGMPMLPATSLCSALRCP
jgi:polyisoprenoid-binding protein YceI